MTNQTPQPAPSSLGQVLAIVQAVVAIVPRWLVVAAGLVFVSWLGLELYFKTRQLAAQTQEIEAVSSAKSAPYIGALVKENPPSAPAPIQPVQRPPAPMIGLDPYRN